MSMIATIAGACVAVAALVTMILVAFQLRQMSQQTQELRRSIDLATYESTIGTEGKILEFLLREDKAADAYLAEMKVNVPHNVSSRNVLLLMRIAGQMESLFYHYKRHAVPEALWSGWEKYLKDFRRTQLFRLTWGQIKKWYWSEFVKFMENDIETQPPLANSLSKAEGPEGV
jgi:hypothetical protein